MPCVSVNIVVLALVREGALVAVTLLFRFVTLRTRQSQYSLRDGYHLAKNSEDRGHGVGCLGASPSTSSHQDFHPWANSPISSRGREFFKSEKRRVPTGSNPLHNKR
ncbi:hypothetical protein Fmac_030856 [Flemingia macrophylla]|uniref:Uncharacterized protein n=1 Tax=Flemingia macrophylla TaxID=520843 RepID=A0ABD1L0D1_9FABA